MNASRAQLGVLAAATLALAMMTIDVSIVRVALATIQGELDMSDVDQQWIVNAYLLTMGAFAIAGGRAGDRWGRRWVFMLGVVVFIVCSVLGGLSNSSEMLIVARAGQGLGAAIMTPGNTAMVTDAFSGASLAKAMGILVGIGSIGVSIGALLGGFLVEFAGWRSVFFINVPVALVVVALVALYVPERRSETAPGLDPAGLVTMVVGITALTLAVMQAPTWGVGSAATIGLLAAAVVTLAAWLWIEKRAKDPLVDPHVLRGPMLGANFVAFCVPFVLSGLAVLLAIYLQNVLGFTALETGALMLPLTVPTLIGSLLTGRAIAWIGIRATVSGGMLLAAIGVFAVGFGAEAPSEYAAMLPGLLLFGLGGGLALPAMTTALMSDVAPAERGMVSGVYNTARLLGATLGLAMMGAMLAGLEAQKLDSEKADGKLTGVESSHIHNLLADGDANGALDGLSKDEAATVKQDALSIFDSAFALTLQLSALVALAGSVVAFFVVPMLRGPPERAEIAHSALAEA